MTDRRPATFGGPGFVPRATAHALEVATGRGWRRCGVRSEVARLREVLLSWPSLTLEFDGDPDAVLMLERPDLGRIRRQCEAVARAFDLFGVVVRVHRPIDPPPPNYLFMRDLVFMTPEGAVLARPASEVRAGEERHAAEALASLGVPLLRTLRGSACLEAADAIWARPDLVLVGTGQRTNAAGFDQVRGVLAELGVAARALPVPDGVQHLLGIVVPADERLAIVDAARVGSAVGGALRDLGYDLLELPPGVELADRRAMNVVTLAPRSVLMPAGCPETRARFRDAGIAAHEVEVGEYVKAGGALGCLTSVLWRE